MYVNSLYVGRTKFLMEEGQRHCVPFDEQILQRGSTSFDTEPSSS